MNRKSIFSSALVWSLMAWPLVAGEPSNVPKPVPATRPELKTALEALKDRQTRLPRQTSADSDVKVSSGRTPDDLLPKSWGGGGVGSGPASHATFNDVFTDPLFWVVSRANNCQYCLGHQELKLRIAGIGDDTIAALDYDWSRFDERQQAALAFARRLTLEPQLVGDPEIQQLKKSFSNAEIIELAFVVARFNAINRWTDGVGLPQEHHFRDDHELLLTTPTNAALQHTKSVVTPDTRASRLAPPTIAEAMKAIAECHHRKARVELPSDEAAKAALKDVIGDREPRNWEQAMAQLEGTGPAQVATLNTIITDDNLNPRLKTELFLITAANNRAWYAVAHAACRLHGMGAGHEDMAALIGENPPGDAAVAYRLAAKSTINPHLITDADIAAVREHFSDAETAEIVQVICMANMFDRFTESLGLPLEDDICD